MSSDNGKRKPRASRIDRIDAALDRLTRRHEALTLNLELLTHNVQQDAANICALARIAEIHEHRISYREDLG